MGSALAHLELAFLCVLALCIALIPALPVPRVWALPAALLVGVETAAVRGMRLEAFEPAVHHAFEPLDTVAEVVALVVVPALTAGLLVVVCWHLARANARVRRALAADAERVGAQR